MISAVKRKLIETFPKAWRYWGVFFDRNSYLRVNGWFETNKRGYPCRPDGTPIPWMNYSVVRFLEERLNQDLNVFEFGSGYSTIFYGSRSRSVVAIEHDRQWVQILKEKLPENAKVLQIDLEDGTEYEDSIAESGREWDVVIVDGRKRMNCFLRALDHLSETGVILLDDSDRERYKVAFETAEAVGFKYLKFSGVPPRKFGQDETTVFYRPGNCLGI